MENKKKIILPTLIAIITLLVLVVGATYAYFTVGTTNNFGTKTIKTSAESIGNVALTTGENLSISLSAADMMQAGTDVTYYASKNGKTTTPTTENIGTTTVTGGGKYSCDYVLTIDDNANSMYDVFQNMTDKGAGQIVLTINGENYDFNESRLFPKEINDNMIVSESNPGYVTASLKIVNKTNVDQSDLAGTNISLSMNVSSFECTAISSIIPEEYQELAYIESTGTQYINTLYNPKTNTIINMDFKTTKEDGDAFTTLFGTQASSSSNRLYILLGTTNNVQANIPRSSTTAAYLSTNGNFNTSTPGNFWENNRTNYILDVKNKKIMIGSTIWDLSTTFKETVTNVNYPLYLLTRNTGGTADVNCSKGYLYGVTIYEDDNLIQKLVPCYRKSDDVVGLYDIVNKKFYTNSGSGTFIKGDEI